MPIVVLSARQHGEDKVDALDAGADDYVTKPFAMNELLARLRAAVRRSAAPADADDEASSSPVTLTIDLARRRVLRDGAEVRLSPTEWSMLEVLVRNRGRLVGRRQLLQEVWGPGYSDETHYLRVYSAQLRRKLEEDPAHPRHILTQPGMGYIVRGLSSDAGRQNDSPLYRVRCDLAECERSHGAARPESRHDDVRRSTMSPARALPGGPRRFAVLAAVRP